MINDITAIRIANSVQMDSGFAGIFLFVEGSRDVVLFKKFIDRYKCQIQVANGKFNIIGAIEILNSRKFQRGLGIIDKDFDEILNITYTISNLISTDFHDIEISIIESDALLHVVETHCDGAKLKKLELENGPIKTVLYSLAKYIGYLKLANKIYNLGLVFKPENVDGRPLNYSNFIDALTLTFKGDHLLVETVFNYSINRTQNCSAKETIIEKLKLVQELVDLDEKHLCNGHDITFIIQLALKKKLGSTRSIELSQKRIELDLSFAYDSTYFISTNLYQEIKKWEDRKKVKILTL
jgi:hypothetical protein